MDILLIENHEVFAVIQTIPVLMVHVAIMFTSPLTLRPLWQLLGGKACRLEPAQGFGDEVVAHYTTHIVWSIFTSTFD